MPQLRDRPSPKNVLDLEVGNDGPIGGTSDSKSDVYTQGSRVSPRNISRYSSGDKSSLDTTPEDIIPRVSRTRTATKQFDFTDKSSATNHNQKGNESSPSDKKNESSAGKKIPVAKVKIPKLLGGSWTDEEHTNFEKGIILHGWGSWKLVAESVPSRDKIQVKSHAQKFARHHPKEKMRLNKEHQKMMKIMKSKLKKANGPTKNKEATVANKKEATAVIPKKMESVKNNAKEAVAKKRKPTNQEIEAAPVKKTKKRKPVSSVKRVSPDKSTGKKAPPARKVIDIDPFGVFKPRVSKTSKTTKKAKTVAWMTPTKNNTPGWGPWTSQEASQFSEAITLYGWGQWEKFHTVVTTRTKEQIKSHAQKFLKHHSEEKLRLDKEHIKLHKQKGMKQTKAVKKASANEKKHASSAKHVSLVSLLKDSKRSAIGGWSLVEEKQFDDGVIFHGWGDWVDISNHIITKDVEQVKEYASGLDEKEKKRLVREHNINFSGGDDKISAKKRLAVPPSPRIPSAAGALIPFMSPPTPKTTEHDLGAAEAIMALNFSNWSPVKKEPLVALKQRPSPSKEDKAEDKNNEANDSLGANNNVEAKANVNEELNSSVATDANNSKEVGEVQEVESDDDSNTKPSAISSQPPPNWLACQTWEACLENIDKWSTLTEIQRTSEYLKYDSFPFDEKETLRKKLIILMNNRPFSRCDQSVKV